MPYVLLSIYAEQLLELQAEEALEAMTVADMPYMKDNDRAKTRREYTKWLNDDAAEDEKPKGLDPKAEHAAATAARFGIKLDDQG